jgi:hypothetical protein
MATVGGMALTVDAILTLTLTEMGLRRVMSEDLHGIVTEDCRLDLPHLRTTVTDGMAWLIIPTAIEIGTEIDRREVAEEAIVQRSIHTFPAMTETGVAEESRLEIAGVMTGTIDDTIGTGAEATMTTVEDPAGREVGVDHRFAREIGTEIVIFIADERISQVPCDVGEFTRWQCGVCFGSWRLGVTVLGH